MVLTTEDGLHWAFSYCEPSVTATTYLNMSEQYAFTQIPPGPIFQQDGPLLTSLTLNAPLVTKGFLFLDRPRQTYTVAVKIA